MHLLAMLTFVLTAVPVTLLTYGGMVAGFVFLVTGATPPVDAHPVAFWITTIVACFLASRFWRRVCHLMAAWATNARPKCC